MFCCLKNLYPMKHHHEKPKFLDQLTCPFSGHSTEHSFYRCPLVPVQLLGTVQSLIWDRKIWIFILLYFLRNLCISFTFDRREAKKSDDLDYDKLLAELQGLSEFTKYEKQYRDESFAAKQEVSWTMNSGPCSTALIAFTHSSLFLIEISCV